MCHSDFIDWKDVSKQIGHNFTAVHKEGEDNFEKLSYTPTDVSGKDNSVNENYGQEESGKQKQGNLHSNDIKIADIKIVKVQKSDPRVLFVKTSYEEENFLKIDVNYNKKIKKGEKKIKNPLHFRRLPVAQPMERKLLSGIERLKTFKICLTLNSSQTGDIYSDELGELPRPIPLTPPVQAVSPCSAPRLSTHTTVLPPTSSHGTVSLESDHSS
ncbi:hypothetical protein J6590_083775 [Homalodisca vitripennis]|nr:hypothetical protein J6590_083775 [Homalodisca vitripennis]